MTLKRLVLLVSVTALPLLVGGGTAQAHEGQFAFPGERPALAPIFASVETVAASYWAVRDVVLPQPPRVLIVPDEALEASGRGEVGGSTVWIAESVVPRRENRWDRRWEALIVLCGTYVHERGHNAGLPDLAPGWPIMGGEASGTPPRCERWAYRHSGR